MLEETAELFQFPVPQPTPARRTSRPEYALADYELLGEFLGGGASAQALARRLLSRFSSLIHVFSATLSELESVTGMSRDQALTILYGRELNERMVRNKIGKRTVLSSWTALLAYVRIAMAGLTREQFRVLFLDKKNQLICDEVMNQGTVAARKHLKQPGFRIMLTSTTSLRITVATARSRTHGDLFLAGEGGWRERRVLSEPRERGVDLGLVACGVPARVEHPLHIDPAEVGAAAAKEYARLFGRCCFCNRGLIDERSTEVGYGPSCAKAYGLPWTPKEAAARQGRLAA